MNPLLLGMLKKAPELIAIAKSLADAVKAGRQTLETAERVTRLEKNEVQQAELIREMARQLNDMTVVIKALNSRFYLCLAGSIVALLLAVAALLLGWGRLPG
jgi:Sec-independent protein translocase protein TatA